MRVLLISPPTRSNVMEVVGTTGPPIGLAYLASMVRDEHDVKIVDSLAEGLTKEDLRRIIKKLDPDMVGLTATTSAVPDAYEVAKIAKEVNENVRVVLGGPHVAFLPERTFKECPHVDFIVRGEGEHTFRELVNAIEKRKRFNQIKGLSFRENSGKIINNPPRELVKNIDELPLPAYNLLPMKKYRLGGTEFGTVMTSRGCPFNCVFCSSSQLFGRRWRGHSPSRAIEELSVLVREHNKKEIEFLDDIFTLVKPRAIEIAEQIRKEKLDVSWSASSRVDTFSSEVAEAMSRSGAHTIYFGLESGSQKTLNFIGKGITPLKSKSAVRIAKEAGLNAFGSFVIGFPEESWNDIGTTIGFATKVGVDFAQFTVATPFPGTRLWGYASKLKLFLTTNWRKFTTLDPVIKLKYFTPRQISRALRFAYVRFYLRPKMLAKDLARGRGFVLKRAIRFFMSKLLRRGS